MFKALRDHFERRPSTSVLAVLALLFVVVETVSSFVAFTSDAFVTTDFVVSAPEVAGPLVRIAVVRNQHVAAGDLLFEIDPKPFALEVARARNNVDLASADLGKAGSDVGAATSNVTAAQAILDDARLTYQRLAQIESSGAVTVQQVDDAKRDYEEAAARLTNLQAMADSARRAVAVQQNQVRVAQSELEIAEYRLSRTKVFAPTSGTVAPYEARSGDYINTGQPVLAVVADTGWRVVANLPDYYLGTLEPGQPVLVQISTDPWRLHRARVSSLPAGVSRNQTPVAVLPYVQPETQWIRLPRRFPIEIDLGALPDEIRLFSGSDARVILFANTFATRRDDRGVVLGGEGDR